jgi:signal peptidase I
MNPQYCQEDREELREEARCSLAAEALQASGVLKLQARGVSMLPTLWPGDILTVRSQRAEEVEPGDVMLYMRRERFFIHRVVTNRLIGNELFLIARGDSMPEADPPVRGGQVLGRITEIRRASSILLPAPELSLLSRVLAYMFCHWDLFRRVGLRLWERSHRVDGKIAGEMIKASS